AVGAEHALGQVGDVHGAALAVAAAGLAAVDLGHHLVHVYAPGDAVAVAAVRAGDAVTVVQVAADADRRRLLARVQVDESGDIAARELRVHALLELADRPHRPVDVEQVLSGQGFPLRRVGHGLLLDGRSSWHRGASEQAEAGAGRQDRGNVHAPGPVGPQPDGRPLVRPEG